VQDFATDKNFSLNQCHNKEEQMLESNVRLIFIILRSGEDLTSFNKPNGANFSGESKVQWSFPGSLFFEKTRKVFYLNLELVVVLVFESKGL